MDAKPTLLQLREKYSVETVALARAAGVAPDIVYYMLVGIPVECWQAERVLRGFKKLTGVEYQLAEIAVTLKSAKTDP